MHRGLPSFSALLNPLGGRMGFGDTFVPGGTLGMRAGSSLGVQAFGPHATQLFPLKNTSRLCPKMTRRDCDYDPTSALTKKLGWQRGYGLPFVVGATRS